MLESILLSLAFIVMPIIILVFLHSPYKNKYPVFLILGVGLNFGFIGVYSGIIYEYIPYGWTKIFLVTGLSIITVYYLLKYIERMKLFEDIAYENFNVFWVISILTILASSGIVYILWKQGWNLSNDDPYFRSVFLSDNRRNQIIVNALIREHGSPFLPNTSFAYQILWHHMAALFVGVFNSDNTYSIVQGLGATTTFIIFFVLLHAVYILRPIFYKKFWIGVPLIILFCLDDDIFSMVGSLITTKYLGMASDIPVWRYFVCSSIFGVALTAYHHGMFLIYVSIYLILKEYLNRSKNNLFLLEILFFTLSYLSSPLLAVFFYFFYFSHECFSIVFPKHKPSSNSGANTISLYIGKASETLKYSMKIGLMVLIALGVHWLVLRFNSITIFTRPVVTKMETPPLWGVLLLPFILVITQSMSGAISTLIFAYRFMFNGKPGFFTNFYAIFLIEGTLFLNYFFTNFELRRHMTMLSTLVNAFFIIKYFPEEWFISPSKGLKAVFSYVVITGISLHAYIIFWYTGKPSVISPSDIKHKDYFCMNNIISKKYPNLPVMTRISGMRGLYLPIAMDVTTAFASSLGAFIHSDLSKEQVGLLNDIDNAKTNDRFVEFSMKLGYKAIIWGLVEEKEWGADVKKQLDEKDLIERCGTVSLYLLKIEEKVKPVVAIQKITASSELDPSLHAGNLISEDSSSPPWHSQKPPAFPEWINFTFYRPTIINVLRLQAQPTDSNGNPQLERAPRDFILQGSQDEQQWTDLLDLHGEQFTSAWEWKEWKFDNTAPYKYYRLYITANNGEPNLITIYRLQLENSNRRFSYSLAGARH